MGLEMMIMTTTTTTTTDLSLQFSALVAAANAGRVATSTLLAAAKDVGDAIEDLVPVGLRLPRHYRRVKIVGRDARLSAAYLHVGCDCDDPDPDAGCDHVTGYVNCDQDGYLYGQFDMEVAATTRAVALRFAQDVASGLLVEITDLVKRRAAKADAAAATLKTACTSQQD